MTVDEYQKSAARTINYRLSRNEQEMHALHLLASEVGEIHGIYQKTYQGHDFCDKELAKEVGDLMWGIAELCTALGWSMSEVCRMNIEKLKKRYPEGFDEERSIHRDERNEG